MIDSDFSRIYQEDNVPLLSKKNNSNNFIRLLHTLFQSDLQKEKQGKMFVKLIRMRGECHEKKKYGMPQE